MPQALNTLYSVGRLPELPQMAKRLEVELGWRPVYWITQPELEDEVKRLFPDIHCHDFTDGNRAAGDPIDRRSLPANTSPDPSALDWTQLLLSLSRHVLGDAIGVEQQVATINERLDYCCRVVSALDIKRFVIASTPHAFLDMCFYVAVRMLGGEARMHHLTGFRGLQVVLDEANTTPFALKAPAASSSLALSDDGKKELAKLLDRDIDQTPWYVRKQDETTHAQQRFYDAADKVLDAGEIRPGTVSFDGPPLLTGTTTVAKQTTSKRIFRRSLPAETETVETKQDVFARKFQPKHDEPMRRAFIHRPEGFAAPAITWREYYTYRDWALIQKRSWLRKYEALTQDFDITKATSGPFVVFALHYQPERTTMPEGGWFADQELAIRMISESLPEEWTLLVKEHPSQFRWQTEGELARDNGFYDRLAGIPGVKLVPLDISAITLIEHASAVATITGTIGWEAALRGVPVVTMANTWYEAPGVTLAAQNASDLAKALVQIKDGWRPTEEAIYDHAARLEAIGARCYINPSHASLYEEMTPEENLEALVQLFVKSEEMKAKCT